MRLNNVRKMTNIWQEALSLSVMVAVAYNALATASERQRMSSAKIAS